VPRHTLPEADAFWSVFRTTDKRESREWLASDGAWKADRDPVEAKFAKILLGIEGTKPTDLC
jgi:hypothetical protein